MEKKIESGHSGTVLPIHTDLYQITMAYSYFQQGKHNENAVFEVFFRKAPFGGQYVLLAGVREVMAFLQNYKICKDQIEYIRSVLPKDVKKEFFDWLSTLDCSKVKIYGIKEGTLVFPKEPLVRVEGPLGLVQMLETSILNLMSYPSLISTNASRMRKLAGDDKKLLEFGLRRAQGPDGGLSAAQYSYLGGFDATSNCLAGMLFNIPVSGTMAHSFVTSYDNLSEVDEKFSNTNEGELASFIAFSMGYPEKFLCLVDTYDTLNSGVPNFVCVALALQDAGFSPIGIRLDSGDLALFSIKTKEIFKSIGQTLKRDLSKCVVVASDDINEESLIKFNEKNHQIDYFGIGTNLVTCQKQPALGLVYKLVELNQISRMKFSGTAEKATLPGRKRLFRIHVQSSNFPRLDLITLFDEEIKENQEICARSLLNLNKKLIIKPAKIVEILELLWDGKLANEITDIHQSKKFAATQIKEFDPKVLDLSKSTPYEVALSEKFFKFFMEIQDKINVGVLIE